MTGGAEPTNEPLRPMHRLRAAAFAEDLSFLLARANALSLAAGNAALAVHGLRVRSYSVLALAVDGTRPSQRDLATFLRLDPSQVVAIVDDLQSRDLIRREADPADRRTNVVVATPEGEALFAIAQRDARTAERDLHRRITGQQREELANLLTLMAFPD